MFSIGNYLSQIKTQTAAPNEITSVVVSPTPEVAKSKDYTALIRNNETKDRIIQGTINETKPLKAKGKFIKLPKPTQEEIDECTLKTKQVLDSILKERLGTNLAKPKDQKSEYIRYTSSDVLTGEQESSRLIKIVDVQQDPMAPPKFKQKKTMERPPSPPAPLLHDPTTKNLTKEEQQKWYIPPAISNWKNPNGFTIALDKRVAIDGRDPVNPGDVNNEEISENFINLAEALEDADKKAREEIKLRNAMKKKLLEKENKEKETKLRILAQRAREQRSKYNKSNYDDINDPEAKKRLLIREERRQKAEKELKMSRMSNETKLKTQSKALLNRDISERTQLGLAKATESRENQFDSRLFTNSTQIKNSEDQVYDNPLFVAQGISSIYKSSKSEEDIELGPIEFEKEERKNKLPEEEMEFGLQKKQKL